MKCVRCGSPTRFEHESTCESCREAILLRRQAEPRLALTQADVLTYVASEPVRTAHFPSLEEQFAPLPYRFGKFDGIGSIGLWGVLSLGSLIGIIDGNGEAGVLLAASAFFLIRGIGILKKRTFGLIMTYIACILGLGVPAFFVFRYYWKRRDEFD